MVFLATEFSDESGPAADTGSAMHRAAAHWHRTKEAAASIDAMVADMAKYPLARLDEAAALFLLYTRDPRNQEAETVLVEERLSFALPPAPEDPTGEPLIVLGTVDQVRKHADGRHTVWDIKTSTRPGSDVLDESQAQIAAYCWGASIALNTPVEPGGIITPRHYGKAAPESLPTGVFWHSAFRFQHVPIFLAAVRRVVANIRSGHVYHNSGGHCRYCPAKTPDACVPELEKLIDLGTLRLRTQF